jgi:hypothetical protein
MPAVERRSSLSIVRRGWKAKRERPPALVNGVEPEGSSVAGTGRNGCVTQSGCRDCPIGEALGLSWCPKFGISVGYRQVKISAP